MSNKVEIKVMLRGEYGDRASVETWLNGKQIGRGRVGGEPEDNMIGRDYDWIVPMLEALAKGLGADVETSETQEQEES